MHRHLERISTLNMPRDEWLRHRSLTIGGSDAAAIVGLSPWVSAYSVWAEKCGLVPPAEENEAMRQGRDLEDYVAKRFTEATGKKVRRENSILRNPMYPFAHANVDRLIIGEDAGLECKTTRNINMRRFANGEFPDNYYVQCVHYMAVTGAKKWYLAVLVFGTEFLWFEIERDEDEIAALMQSEEAFWKLVESRIPPAVDGTESTTETIKAVFTDADDTEVDLTMLESILTQYEQVKARIEELSVIKAECENKVKVFMDTGSRGVTDSYKVSWQPQISHRFDAKRFAADHPDMDLSGYYNKSTSRPFKVTKRKDV